MKKTFKTNKSQTSLNLSPKFRFNKLNQLNVKSEGNTKKPKLKVKINNSVKKSQNSSHPSPGKRKFRRPVIMVGLGGTKIIKLYKRSTSFKADKSNIKFAVMPNKPGAKTKIMVKSRVKYWDKSQKASSKQSVNEHAEWIVQQ